MRWRGLRKSSNVEDKRGEGGGFGFPFPGRGRRVRIPMPGSRRGRSGGIGIFGILIILGLMFFLGIDPSVILQGGGAAGPGTQTGFPKINMPKFDSPASRQNVDRQVQIPGLPKSGTSVTGKDDEMKAFVSTILGTTEDVWSDFFKRSGRSYKEPSLVLFTNSTRSGCGRGMAQMGPFYCPLDQKIYIDLSFFKELKTRFRAPGDFAQAYVIAHEVGHHVQTLLGISKKVQQGKQRLSKREGNRLQVMMELQADCLSGIWASRLQKNVLEPGDIEEGLNAASAIGDDRIQKQTQGYVVPDAFTHGSSKQRVRWFKRGYEGGRMQACDTFNSKSL